MTIIQEEKQTKSQLVNFDGQKFFKISDINRLRPFFMSIVSNSNHWLFISSNGGLSAGRKNANYALFPYYTDDKITKNAENTGSKTIMWVSDHRGKQLWEPFSIRQGGKYRITRNLYKSVHGNKVRFEEENLDLKLRFSYQWQSSDKFGFIRTSYLENFGSDTCEISIIDGIQNILPSGVPSDLQNQTSNLVDAYKRSELDRESGLGIFTLSAIIVDKAEPSESLMANIAGACGLDISAYLLSSLQLQDFRNGNNPDNETDIKAEPGAYLLHSEFELKSDEHKRWTIFTDVNKDHPKVIQAIETLNKEKNLEALIMEDVYVGTQDLVRLIASSDGMQMSADFYRDSRHFSNVLFNVMRGGIFDDNYTIEKVDFSKYLQNANPAIYASHKKFLDKVDEKFNLDSLHSIAKESGNPDFQRLSVEYLPLKFSRRHGDPSRPWNRFSINTRDENDGSKILDYEGNWRDIFQNWEALVHSYPHFIESMICKFLNASTFEGYNPYRVTKDGFDWETIEPDDPWSYIGYWGDHQVIYLLKFLEFQEKHSPGRLAQLMEEEIYVYANVPYRIKPYTDILRNPKDTIDFDHEAHEKIHTLRAQAGSDGALLRDESGQIYHVNLIEKLLAIILSKLSNFIPEAGIWMNTQRPEWNDANNALVGNGVSMVTLYYLRRYLGFMEQILSGYKGERVKISSELIDFYRQVRKTFEENLSLLQSQIDDHARKQVTDQLGQAGSDYRTHIYNSGFWGKKRSVSINGIRDFISNALEAIDHSIRANKRPDNMYHAYNIISIHDSRMSISYLDEMLEGQVAVLSSGFLTNESSLEVLNAMKTSALFREDQYSYLLYPEKQLPGFLDKNRINEKQIQQSLLLSKLISEGNTAIVNKDIRGNYHFNGAFRNADILKLSLDQLEEVKNGSVSDQELQYILDLYEEIFNHKAFTGRSGTFFGYEGLGSIYWHMVSKLLLAVQESSVKAIKNNADDKLVGQLLDHYYEVYEGIGVHKSPELYGAFSTDPYSHTPGNKGAQQPGMTGQVKEDIIARYGELGVFVENGEIIFYPCLLRKTEFLSSSKDFRYFDVFMKEQSMRIEEGCLCFTYCQTPIIYRLSVENRIFIHFSNGQEIQLNSNNMGEQMSQLIFSRNGEIKKVLVDLNEQQLK